MIFLLYIHQEEEDEEDKKTGKFKKKKLDMIPILSVDYYNWERYHVNEEAAKKERKRMCNYLKWVTEVKSWNKTFKICR